MLPCKRDNLPHSCQGVEGAHAAELDVVCTTAAHLVRLCASRCTALRTKLLCANPLSDLRFKSQSLCSIAQLSADQKGADDKIAIKEAFVCQIVLSCAEL